MGFLESHAFSRAFDSCDSTSFFSSPNFFEKIILLLKINPFFFNFVFICVSTIGLYLRVQCPQRPEDVVRSPGAGVVGDCKLSDLDAGNQVPVLCQNSTCS